MKIFQGFDQLEAIPHPVLTIGTFDGVHLGHQKIIQQVNNIAKENGGESVLFTFYPHPRMVLFPDSHGLKLLQTQEEKLAKLKRMGLQNIIVHPFTKEFSRIPAIEFIRDYLVNKLNVKTLVIGYDHHFGKNREGDIHLLKEVAPTYGFEVVEISAKDIDEVNVSSTKIRKALINGKIHKANSFLGNEFQLNGTVVHGEKLGRELGFPTANIDLESDVKLIPKDGIYASKVQLEDGSYQFGLLSIGSRPTVDDSGKLCIEVYLLDFSDNIYDSQLKIKLLRHIRDNKKFNSKDELITAMQGDEKCLRDWIITYNW